MSKHFGAVEADFQAHYGLDLREVLWGERPAGVRRIVALVDGLPIQGAVFRQAAMHGKYWTTTEELLATLIEVTDLTNRLLYGANRAKDTPPVWKPLQIDRPGTEPQKALPPPVATAEEVRAFFNASETGEVVIVDG